MHGLKVGPYYFGYLNNRLELGRPLRLPTVRPRLSDGHVPGGYSTNTGLHPVAKGLLLPIDAHPTALKPCGGPAIWRNRIQSIDSTFTLDKTDGIPDIAAGAVPRPEPEGRVRLRRPDDVLLPGEPAGSVMNPAHGRRSLSAASAPSTASCRSRCAQSSRPRTHAVTGSPGPPPGAAPAPADALHGGRRGAPIVTYSIVARDRATGDLAVAVQSRFRRSDPWCRGRARASAHDLSRRRTLPTDPTAWRLAGQGAGQDAGALLEAGQLADAAPGGRRGRARRVGQLHGGSSSAWAGDWCTPTGPGQHPGWLGGCRCAGGYLRGGGPPVPGAAGHRLAAADAAGDRRGRQLRRPVVRSAAGWRRQRPPRGRSRGPGRGARPAARAHAPLPGAPRRPAHRAGRPAGR